MMLSRGKILFIVLILCAFVGLCVFGILKLTVWNSTDEQSPDTNASADYYTGVSC